MHALVPFTWLLRMGALYVLIGSFLSGQTAVIFTTDDNGNVGRIEAGQSSGTAIGSLTSSGFTPRQVIGLAYDSNTNGLLLFDRNANTVYTMDATTGVTTVLFTTPGVQLQGGAIYGGLVYGIDETTQQLKAYTFAGVEQTLSYTALIGHVHSLGINPVTKKFFYLNTSNALRSVNINGADEGLLLTTSQGSEDIAYFDGDYLVANYDRNLYFLDGTTGIISTYLTNTELTTMGVTGSVSGVVLEYITVPEPGTWALMLMGIAVIAVVSIRRKRTS